jgi:SAM-dependent methyltransferase
MPVEDDAHLLRDRAESFGAVAAAYDRYRPGYPADLVDALVDLAPRRVLDVGCGTGKAARLLTARGLDVLGVEPDPAMAAVARTHGLRVEVGAFESWDAAGRTFDLITCAQAWHWIEPRAGAAKASRLLTPGGTLALMWNFDEPAEDVRQAFDEVYARLAPELGPLVAAGADRPAQRPYERDLRASGRFAFVRTQTYPWQRELTVDHWLGVLGTQSDHLLLGPQRLAALQVALRAALTDTLGGEQARVQLTGGTYTVFARV